jgi:hypothetical protein
MHWHGRASGKRGRSPKYSEAAVQFCLTIKGLFNLPLRQAVGMAQSLLKLAGLDWQVPDFSTISRRQRVLSVTIGAQPTRTGLHLLVDSTGIKMLGEGKWKTKKHGADYRRQWRKVHLGINATTLEIRAIEVTDNATGDAPMLPCLLEQLRRARQSRASVAMAPMTRRAAMKPSPDAARKRSSRRARTPSRGRINALALMPAMPFWRPRGVLAGKSGKGGPATIDAVSWKPNALLQAARRASHGV